MYKKIVVYCLLFGIMCISGKSYAATDTNIQGTYVGPCEQADDISKTIFMEVGKEKEVCIQFTTISPEPVRVAYGFVNKDLDANGNPVCAVDVNPKDPFNSVFVNKTGMDVIVTKDTPSIVKDIIRVPFGISGSVLGCITYTTEKVYATGIGGMLNLVIRKVYPISLFVGSGDTIKNSIEILKSPGGVYSTNANIKATLDTGNNLSLGFLIKNKGNIQQDIVVTGKVYNFLGFEKEFSIKQSIDAGTTGYLSTNIGILPLYKGLFSVNYAIGNQPKFDFDASSIDAKYKTGGYVVGSGSIFAFSWIILIIIGVVLLFVIRYFIPKKKVQVTT